MSDDRQHRSGDGGKALYCSFCGKSQHEVRKLIYRGPSVFICDECVEPCNDIIREEPEDRLKGRSQQSAARNPGCPGSVRDRPATCERVLCRWRCTIITNAGTIDKRE